MSQETSIEKKPWYKKTSGRVLIGAIAVFILVGIFAPDPTTTTNTQTEQTSEQPKYTVASIGQPARDGKFEFVVKSIECGQTSVGTNPYMTKEAQGQFCLLNLSVKNIGNEAQSLFSANQKLLNDKGQMFSADDTATLYASPGSESWYANINPGNTVEGTIVFDLPKDQTPVKAELHDSAFSGGVEVKLQ